MGNASEELTKKQTWALWSINMSLQNKHCIAAGTFLNLKVFQPASLVSQNRALTAGHRTVGGLRQRAVI